MDQKELDEILEKHRKWLASEPDGERAVVNDCDMHGLDLSDRHLRGCDLSFCDMSHCDISGSDLSECEMTQCILNYSNLSYSDMHESDIYNCELIGCNMHDSDMRDCDMIECDMRNSDLRNSNLSNSRLRNSNLGGCLMVGCNLAHGDLSGCKGLVSPIRYMEENFDRSSDGYIAYKVFNASYIAPGKWEIRPGAVINETVNANRTDDCGCGVNVATLDWVEDNCRGKIWKVLIRWEWLPGVCVPYNTDGKIRCERVELIEIVQ